MGLLLVLTAATALAGDVVQAANLLAMGGVGAAAPVDNAGITMNPGLLGLKERYDFHAHFRLGPELGLQWGATAMDGRTSKVIAAGLAYTGDRFDQPFTNDDLPAWTVAGDELRNRKRLQDIAAALSIPVLGRRLSFGVTGNLTIFNHDFGGRGNRFDLHAGVGARPIDALTLGVAVRNMIPTEEDDRPTELIAGVRLEDADNIALEVNASRMWLSPGAVAVAFESGIAQLADDPSDWSMGGGLEKQLGSAAVRAGGRWVGPERQAYATFGLGTRNEGGGIEYGIAVPIGGDTGFGDAIHQVSVRFGAPPGIEAP